MSYKQAQNTNAEQKQQPRFTVRAMRQRFVMLVLCLLLIASQAIAQTSSDGTKPKMITPGAPAGSYSLSGFESINLFNGNLNFNFPLLKIGGRGKAQSSISLSIDSARWNLELDRASNDMLNAPSGNRYNSNYIGTISFRSCDYDWGAGHPPVRSVIENTCVDTTAFNWDNNFTPTEQPINSSGTGYMYYEVTEDNCSVRPGYGPGILVGRGGKIGRTNIRFFTLTRLYFVTPDGTEYELRDTLTEGEPIKHSQYESVNRGKHFTTADGSNVLFISDANINDVWDWNSTCPPLIYPSGYLYFSDGTVYRIDEGTVTWITDVNGNKISYLYNSTTKQVTEITDALNRKVKISYNNATTDAEIKYDQISFRSDESQSATDESQWRKLKIYRTRLGRALRSDFQLLTKPQLFPELGQPSDTTLYDPTGVASKVELPDGRSYNLYYTPYNEISRVELPTGATIEYTFPMPEEGGGAPPTGGTIFRPVKERRVYSTGNSTTQGSNYELRQIYTRDASTINNVGYSEVTVESEVRNPISGLESQAKEVHTFYGRANHIQNRFYPKWTEGREYKTEIYAHGSSVPFRRTETEWEKPLTVMWNDSWVAKNVRVKSVKNTMMDVSPNLISKEVYGYDPSNSFNNQTDVWKYEFGTGTEGGALVQHTKTTFMLTGPEPSPTPTPTPDPSPEPSPTPMPTPPNDPCPQCNHCWTCILLGGESQGAPTRQDYIERNILSLSVETKIYGVKNGQEILLARQAFSYDETALESRSNVSGWVNPNSAARGLLTSTRSWINTQDSSIDQNSEQAYIKSQVKYDVLGNPVETTDGRGNKAYVYYEDNFGIADGESQTNDPPDGFTLSTFAFATKARNALGHEAYTQYNYFSGAKVNDEDFNGVVNKYLYNDLLDRPTQAVYAVGTQYQFQTSIFYHDGNNDRRIETKTDLNAFNDNVLRSESLYDSLGRTYESRSYETASTYIATQTKFDGLGRAIKVSNPYRSGTSENDLKWSFTRYDSLGRVYEVESPKEEGMTEGVKAQTYFEGNRVLTVDPAGKKFLSKSDAFGRLTDVWEIKTADSETESVSFPNFSNLAGYHTSYVYDGLGNMRQVNQGSQHRYFMYDSLGRLLRVKQPEQDNNSDLTLTDPITGNTQWSAASTFDNNGNLLTATDTKGVVISNTYDVLNRVLTRNYQLPQTTDPKKITFATPNVTFKYDGVTENIPFAKGKLIEVSNGISTTKYTEYNQIGQLVSSEQVTDGVVYPSRYKYNFAGSLEEQKYPSGRVVRNHFGADGKLSSISSRRNVIDNFRTYASDFTYTPSGVIEKLRVGNGRWEAAKFNNQLQITELALGTSPTDTSLWKLNYEYGELDSNGNVVASKNNGNIARQTLSYQGLSHPFVQTFKYDSLDRLKEAKETTNGSQNWIQTFDYDRYGNRTNFAQTIGTDQLTLNNLTHPSINAATNRFNANQGYEYDYNGNLIQDAQNRKFSFNGDNKQAEVRDANDNLIGQYFYDAEGKRVKKLSQTENIIFVYDGAGKLVAEYKINGTAPTNSQTSYVVTDTLQSVRAITNQNGEVTSRRDFMPFGEELYAGQANRTVGFKYSASGSDNLRKRFTGYEKDTETGLDFAEARYYNNQHGRFTAVDPLLASGKSANPQTFNRYSYVMNSPLRFTDPSGMQAGTTDKDGYDADDVIRIDVWTRILSFFSSSRSTPSTSQQPLFNFTVAGETFNSNVSTQRIKDNLSEFGIGAGKGARNFGRAIPNAPFEFRPVVNGLPQQSFYETTGWRPFDYESPDNFMEGVGMVYAEAGLTVATAKIPSSFSRFSFSRFSSEAGVIGRHYHSVYSDGLLVFEGQQPARIGTMTGFGHIQEAQGPYTVLRWDAVNNRVYQGRTFNSLHQPILDIDFTVPTFPNGRPRPNHAFGEIHPFTINNPSVGPSSGFRRGKNAWTPFDSYIFGNQ